MRRTNKRQGGIKMSDWVLFDEPKVNLVKALQYVCEGGYGFERCNGSSEIVRWIRSDKKGFPTSELHFSAEDVMAEDYVLLDQEETFYLKGRISVLKKEVDYLKGKISDLEDTIRDLRSN